MTYYTNEERDSDVVLLFLHGWGCDSSIFDTVTPLVKQSYYSLDLWGFGGSTLDSNCGLNVEQYADRVAEWCSEMQLAKVVVIGHSFGGRVAVMLASKYPNLVSKLLLVGSAGLRRFSLVRSLKVASYKWKKFLVRCGLVSNFSLVGQGSIDYNAIDGDSMKNTFVKVVTQDLSRQAKKIKCPTLLVWGKNDADTPLWMAKRYNKLIANSELIVLDGSHYVFLNNNVQFAGIIDAFAKEEE